MNPETSLYSQLIRKFGAEGKAKARFFTDTAENSAKQYSLLTEAFIKPLFILTTFGNNPVYFRKVEYGNTGIWYRSFEFKRFSWLTTISFIQQIIYTCMFTVLAYRLFHGDYQASSVPGTGIKAKHGSAYSDGLMKAFLVSYFLACAGGALSSFLTTPKLCKYFEKWKNFVFYFPKVFPDKCIDLGYVNRISNTGACISLFISSVYSIWAVNIYKTCIFDTYNNCTRIEREQSILIALFGGSNTLNTSFENFKLILMMRTTAHAFSQIKHCLHGSKSRFSKGISNLKDLFHLVHVLRGQVTLMTELCGTQQLLILFFLFSLTIIGWMMGMQFTEGNITISLVLVVSSIGLVTFARFALIAVLSERIVENERSVLDEISEIKLHSVKAQIEVQLFANLLTKKPSEFVVNNIIAWKRSLFLALMSNSATYLIAILQLVDVSNSDTIGLSSSPGASNFTKQ